jgi:hypothetical protein
MSVSFLCIMLIFFVSRRNMKKTDLKDTSESPSEFAMNIYSYLNFIPKNHPKIKLINLSQSYFRIKF